MSRTIVVCLRNHQLAERKLKDWSKIVLSLSWRKMRPIASTFLRRRKRKRKRKRKISKGELPGRKRWRLRKNKIKKYNTPSPRKVSNFLIKYQTSTQEPEGSSRSTNVSPWKSAISAKTSQPWQKMNISQIIAFKSLKNRHDPEKAVS